MIVCDKCSKQIFNTQELEQEIDYQDPLRRCERLKGSKLLDCATQKRTIISLHSNLKMRVIRYYPRKRSTDGKT